MGSNSIFGVIAVTIFFGLIASSLNERDRRAEEAAYGYIKYTTAREIARSAINIALKRVSEDVSLSYINGSLDGGSYTVSWTRKDSIMQLISVAHFSDTTYRIQTRLFVYPKPFPRHNAAVALHVDTLGNFALNPGKGGTKVMIDGRNYDSSGTTWSWDGAVPGVAVLNSTDSLLATKPSDTGKIYGTEDVVVDPIMPDPDEFIDQYIANADRILLADSLRTQTVISGGTWGTADNPEITFIDAIDPAHQVKINGNTSGWGILVMRGNVWFNGGLEFHGLVILYDDTQIDFDDLGNAKIIGSLLMGGPTGSTFEMNGNGKILYSSDALRDAQYIGKLLAYRILDWYE